MIARLTRLMIAMQALTFGSIAFLLVRLAEFSWPSALIASAVVMLLARVIVIVNNYHLSAAWRQPMADGSSVPLSALAGRIAQEFWCSMLCWFRLFPLGRPFNVHCAGDAKPPVLMLHGYGANSGFWHPYSRRLKAAGISHAAINLEPVMADIDSYAPAIDDAVQRLRRVTGAPKVILLCHSMGGLAARAWLRACGSECVARVITLGTPHFGTTLAGYGFGKNVRQMLTPAGDSDSWIARLDASESREVRSLVTSIYTRHDNIVSPQSSAILPGAKHITFELVGHVALGFDADVGEQVLAEISSIRQSKLTAEIQ